MKHDVTEYLERLGLSEQEAKIYISLLKTGVVNARDLAKTSGVRRTSAYNGLNLLIEKGLINKLESGTQTLFEANQPQEILPYLVQQKEKRSREVADSLPLMLSTLTSLAAGVKAKTSREVEIKYVTHQPAVKKIYEEALQASELRSYVNITEIEKVFPENKQLFDAAIRRNPDMQMFEIVEDSPEARKRFEGAGTPERYFYKYFPKNMQLTAQDILIYDNNVAIIHFKDTISAVVHRDADLYNNFKVLFDYIWRTLPPVQAEGKG